MMVFYAFYVMIICDPIDILYHVFSRLTFYSIPLYMSFVQVPAHHHLKSQSYWDYLLLSIPSHKFPREIEFTKYIDLL